MRSRPARLVGLLSLISFVNYPLRTNITVAAKQMMPELGLSQIQMGNVFSSFQLFYALFQIPAGLLGDRFGPRAVMTAALVIWALSSLATGLVPATALGLTIGLLYVSRATLGIGEAATYPVGAIAIRQQVPPGYRARANGIFISSAAAGSALTPPLIAWGMTAYGWRSTFVAAAGVTVLLAVVWLKLAPRGGAPVSRASAPETFRRALDLLRNRNLLLVSVSYMGSGSVWFLFVYWFYIYLTDVRGFTILQGGVFAAAPYLAAALIGPFGGVLADVLSPRVGARKARRTAVLVGLVGAALAVTIGLQLANPYLAIVALSLSSALVNFVEGPFWAAATDFGSSQPGLAGGVLNTFGNLGGVFSTLAVPRMVEHWGWTPAIGVFGAIAVGAAALWFLIED